MKKLLTLSLLLLSSCASQQVPKSVLDFSLATGSGHFSLPKDTDIKGLEITTGPDGKVTGIKIQQLKTRTNPDVVEASGVATAQAFTAFGDATLKAMEKGIEIGKKAVP